MIIIGDASSFVPWEPPPDAAAIAALVAAFSAPQPQGGVAEALIGAIPGAISSSGGGISGQSVNLTNVRLISIADSGTADAEFSFSHNLGRVPSFAILFGSSIAGSLYDNFPAAAATAWTSTLGYAKFTGANANLLLGVL